MRRLATVLAIAAAGLAGCGGDDKSAEDEIRTAVRDYLTAVASGKPERTCATLTDEARRDIVDRVTAALGSSAPMSCGEAARELSADVAPEDKPVLLDPKVEKVTIDGDRASVAVSKLAEPLPLRRVGEDWRVASSVYEVAR